MKESILIVFIGICLSSYAQQFTISGTIKDKASQENIAYISAYDTLSNEGTLSNAYGFYTLSLPKGVHTLGFVGIGYQNYTITLDLTHDTLLNPLLIGNQTTDSVIIKAQPTQSASSISISRIQLPVQQIQKMPSFLGEADIFKAIQLLPGITFGQEGTSGIFVRGGSPDQNLILFDEMPIYNVSHLFGFFSLFSPDAIKNIEVIKGGFPAKYGGRLSSVIEIQTKEGDMNKWHGSGHIGITSLGFSLNGPLKKEKVSCFLSFRRSMIDAFMRPASYIRILKEGGIGSIGYNFYDGIAKVNAILSPNSRLYFSFYAGRDRFSTNVKSLVDTLTYKGSTELDWGNLTTSLRYQQIISPKIFLNMIGGYSQYHYNTTLNVDLFDKSISIFKAKAGFYSTIRDIIGKQTISFSPNNRHQIEVGMEETYKIFVPNINIITLNNNTTQADTNTQHNSHFSNYTHSFFAEESFKPNQRFSLNIGLRGDIWQYQAKSQFFLQPRFSTRYMLNDEWSIKAGYSLINQYLHLISNSGLGQPNDIWVPSTQKIPPASSHQLVVGINKDIYKSIYLSVEAYYKTLQNVIDYKDGNSFASNYLSWQDKVSVGKGTAYGIEFFAHKPEGKWNGWISYTLAWNQRQFADINEGKSFPFRYDRRHNISLFLSRELGKPSRNIALTWVFVSGYKTTLPTELYNVPPNLIENSQQYPGTFAFIDYTFTSGYVASYASGRNNYSLRPFHKLDISYQNTKKTKWGERTWAYGIYNVYGRRNPYYIYLQKYKDYQHGGEWTSKLKEYSFMMWIPSVSYTVHF